MQRLLGTQDPLPVSIALRILRNVPMLYGDSNVDIEYWAKRLLGVMLLLLVAAPSYALLVSPRFQSIHSLGDRVFVQHFTRLLAFDRGGNFLAERELAIGRSGLVLSIGEDGRVWTLEEGEEATVFTLFGPANENVGEHTLPGPWSGFVGTEEGLFVGQIMGSDLRIERLDLMTKERTRYFEISLERPFRTLDLSVAPAVKWAIHPDGDVFILATWREAGSVTRYTVTGEALASWEVSADPETSVSFLRDVQLAPTGEVLVTHSSWEVSSSNIPGSVAKFDAHGELTLRVQDRVGYLQGLAVTDSGELFVINLSDRVVKYSPDGAFTTEWIAVPPRFGEGWEERRRAVDRLAGLELSASTEIDDLIWAVAYNVSPSAWDELVGRGGDAILPIAEFLVSFEEYSLLGILRRLCEAHPDEAVAAYHEGSAELKRALAEPLAWVVEEPLPGQQEILIDRVKAGDRDARSALNHIGAPPGLINEYVEGLTRAWDSGKEDSDLEYSLVRAYPESQEALGRLLEDTEIPYRTRVRKLILRASAEVVDDPHSDLPRGAPELVIKTTQTWLQSNDLFVSDTAAAALVSLGVPGYESRAIAAVRRSPELLLDVLDGFKRLGAVEPSAVDRFPEELGRLVLEHPTAENWMSPLATFFRIGTPGVVAVGWQYLQDDALPVTFRADGLYGLNVTHLPPERLQEALSSPSWWQPFARSAGFLSFLEDVVESYSQDANVLALVRSLLVDTLEAGAWRATVTPDGDLFFAVAIQRTLEVLKLVITETVAGTVLPFVRDYDGSTRYAALEALSRVKPTEDSLPLLEGLLADPDLRLLAAKSLGRIGHPDALGILIEDGLKLAGSYSFMELEAESFEPYGPRAEEALLPLLAYPDSGTRGLVRILLGRMQSSEGILAMQADLTSAVEKGEWPEAGVVAGLLAAGEDPMPRLVELVTTHPEMESYYSLPCGEFRSYFVESLLNEVDAGQARAQAKILRLACWREEEAILGEVQKQHSSSAVRLAIAEEAAQR